MLSVAFTYGQMNQYLEQFIDLLTSENLKANETKLKQQDGTNLTFWTSFELLPEKYTISKLDLSKLDKIRWTTKEELDMIYPENKSTNKSSANVTLFFNEGNINNETFFTVNNSNSIKNPDGSTSSIGTCTNCNFVNIHFINSSIAEKATSLLESYLKEK